MPPPKTLRIAHHFTHYQTLGGVQSILRTHLKLDPTQNLNPTLLAYFEPPTINTPQQPNIHGLGLTGLHTIHQARRLYQQHQTKTNYNIPIFHDLWGLPFLGQYDQNPHRRIGAIHSQWPHLDHQLQQLQGTLDGVICDSQHIADLAHSHLPEIPDPHIQHLPVPAQTAPQHTLKPRPPLQNRTIQLAYIGRLENQQKQLHHLPQLHQTLQQHNIPHHLHILGQGKTKKTLQKQIPQNHITFHGTKTGTNYWNTLTQIDFSLNLSDHEGTPLTLIESMSAHNIPIYPRIYSGGDTLIRQINPKLLYPPQNWNHIAHILKTHTQQPHQTTQQTRQQCRQTALQHSPQNYHKQFTQLLHTILQHPKTSQNFTPNRPPHLTDHIPLALLTRLNPLALHKPNPIQQPQTNNQNQPNHTQTT